MTLNFKDITFLFLRLKSLVLKSLFGSDQEKVKKKVNSLLIFLLYYDIFISVELLQRSFTKSHKKHFKKVFNFG